MAFKTASAFLRFYCFYYMAQIMQSNDTQTHTVTTGYNHLQITELFMNQLTNLETLKFFTQYLTLKKIQHTQQTKSIHNRGLKKCKIPGASIIKGIFTKFTV